MGVSISEQPVKNSLTAPAFRLTRLSDERRGVSVTVPVEINSITLQSLSTHYPRVDRDRPLIRDLFVMDSGETGDVLLEESVTWFHQNNTAGAQPRD